MPIGKTNDRSAVPYIYYRGLAAGFIRLFTLFPGEPNSQLRGMISIVPLKQSGHYRALSYIWGVDEQSMHTLITPEGTLRIRESLSATPHRLRLREAAVVLWIDALCVNQNNNHEKAKQIRLLGDIFQNATCTLAFLGADDKSHAAIETLMQIRANRVHGRGSENWPKNLPPSSPSWGEKGMPPSDDPIWQDIVAFFERPWFRRAWIVQEAVIAPTVKIVCGQWMFDWNDLFFAMDAVNREMRHVPDVDPDSWQPFLKLASHREWEARQTRWSLFLLLETFRHVRSQRMRDRFFALLGIAEDGHLAAFEPDYDSDFEVIVCRVASAFVEMGQGIQLLSRASLGSQPDRFPSWIPDWTVPRPSSLSDSLYRGIVYNAAGTTEASVALSPDPHSNELLVEGILVDELTQVSKHCNMVKDDTSRTW